MKTQAAILIKQQMAKFFNTIKTKDHRTFVVRNCDFEDLDALKEFLQKGAQETNHTLAKDLPNPLLQAKIDNGNNSSCEMYLGVFDKEKIIGHLHVKAPHHPCIKHIAEFGMLILKEYWGKGIAHSLLIIIEEFAKKTGITKIEAKVRIANTRALALYQRNGYTIEGLRKEAAFVQGKYADEFFLAKFLKD